MIRNLEPDELAWFMRQALAFVGHPDPGGLSLRVNSQLRDAVADAAHCLVAAPSAGAPTAGLYVVKKGGGYAALELEFRSAWQHSSHSARTSSMMRVLKKCVSRSAGIAPRFSRQYLSHASAPAARWCR